MSKLRAPVLIALTLVASALVAGCQWAPATIHVVMKDIAFVPADIAAKVGDRVVFDNMDFIAHTATATDGGSFDVTLDEGKTASITLGRPGVIHYICRFHPNMTGTITVAAN